MKSNTNPKVPYRMERVRALINKLQEQLDEQADNQALLATIQLLQAELQPPVAAPVSRNGSSKVAVVMPSSKMLRERLGTELLPWVSLLDLVIYLKPISKKRFFLI